MTVVIVPAGTPAEELGVMPAAVELVAVDGAASLDKLEGQGEMIVFGSELRPMLPQLGSMRSLQVIQALSAGVEWLLPHVPDAVTVCNASDVHDGPVAEWVVGVILATYREFPRYLHAQQQGRWDSAGNALTDPPAGSSGDDLEGKTVLIVGHGAIGRAVQRRLEPFDVRVIGVTRTARDGTRSIEDLPALLRDADVVVLSLPLTGQTRHLVDDRFLRALPHGALVVNASRGAVVDQAALESHLRAGRLRAAIDVTDPEPLPAGHSLWSAPNLIITPHTAGPVRRWRTRAHRLAGDQIRRYVAGEALINVVGR